MRLADKTDGATSEMKSRSGSPAAAEPGDPYAGLTVTDFSYLQFDEGDFWSDGDK